MRDGARVSPASATWVRGTGQVEGRRGSVPDGHAAWILALFLPAALGQGRSGEEEEEEEEVGLIYKCLGTAEAVSR